MTSAPGDSLRLYDCQKKHRTAKTLEDKKDVESHAKSTSLIVVVAISCTDPVLFC